MRVGWMAAYRVHRKMEVSCTAAECDYVHAREMQHHVATASSKYFVTVKRP
jgi:hypothetical protein